MSLRRKALNGGEGVVLYPLHAFIRVFRTNCLRVVHELFTANNKSDVSNGKFVRLNS